MVENDTAWKHSIGEVTEEELRGDHISPLQQWAAIKRHLERSLHIS